MALGLGSLKKQDSKNTKSKKETKNKNAEAEDYLKKLEEKKSNNPEDCIFC